MFFNVVLADPLMGYYIMVLQSSIMDSARAVLARVEMCIPIFRSYILRAFVALFVGAWFASCMGVLTSHRRSIFRVVARDVIIIRFQRVGSVFWSPPVTIFVSYHVGFAETVILRPNLFGGRRLDRKHPEGGSIRNLASATVVDGKKRYWIWH